MNRANPIDIARYTRHGLVGMGALFLVSGLGTSQVESEVGKTPPVAQNIPDGTQNLTTQSVNQTSPGTAGVAQDVMWLTVDKKSLVAEIRTLPENNGPSVPVRSYRVAIGKQDGDKERSGDNRTPEGIYFTMDAFDTADRSLPKEKYGPKAIPLNFPNPIDQAAGKTGHGIWLHGAGNDSRIEESKTTEGCVAFYNSEVQTLERWLRPNQGIVVIAQDISAVNKPDDLREVQEATTGWAAAWNERRLDDYIGFYAPSFSFKGGKRDAYRAYKQLVFSGYKTMSVKFEKVRVVSHPKYALSIMNQDFRGDGRFSSIGRKVLYWERAADTHKWQITHEIHDSHHVEVVSVSADFPKESLSRQNASSTPKVAPASL